MHQLLILSIQTRGKKYQKNLTPADKQGPIPSKNPKVPDKFCEQLFVGNEEEKKNPLAIKVNSSSSGGMTQVTFFD